MATVDSLLQFHYILQRLRLRQGEHEHYDICSSDMLQLEGSLGFLREGEKIDYNLRQLIQKRNTLSRSVRAYLSLSSCVHNL